MRHQASLLSKRRASTTMEQAIADYLLDHEGGNSSQKTLQWHRTALGLLRGFLEEERGITLVGEVDAPDINAWFASMRKTPSSRGKVRAERTIQTYARSARAFFHWLVRRETIERSPFDRVVFPKVGKPLIRTIESEEFERLLVACTPPGEVGPLAACAAARNRAILWVHYDTGIRLSELCTGWAVTALLALQAGQYVGRKRDYSRLYRNHIGDEWSSLLEEVATFRRDEWQYLIPTEHQARKLLREICERTLRFEQHFLTVYKPYLLEQLCSTEQEHVRFTMWLQEQLPLDDAEVTAVRQTLGQREDPQAHIEEIRIRQSSE